MGRGKSKLKKQTQNTSRSYNAGGNIDNAGGNIDDALAKTKGYDNLTKNEKENRGRKKKK